MKYIDEFRDGALARQIAARISAEADPLHSYRFMEFCGGHTHAISRYGVLDLLPPNLRMIHGPGCPVCVLPIGRLDMAIDLALRQPITLCTYGDTLRVPASEGASLLKAKARGADIRMVYSAADALELARQQPEREVVFFAIGFETTTPPTALVLDQAERTGLRNFSVMCNHVLTPPAIRAILDGAHADEGATAEIEGFVGPAHVSIVIGSEPYARFARDYRKPVVIAGFEPLDVLQAILMLVRQVNQGRAEVENEFTRAVTPTGNLRAQALMEQVFELRPSFEWRGLGSLAHSALQIRPRYSAYDAEQRYGLQYRSVADNKACECGAILRGVKEPRECKIFGTVCTPENPIGSCMVSSEGACAAHYTYGRFRDIPIVAAVPTQADEVPA
ncbi:MAG: hydrogenase formation protein HypD [Betaproteobacteria bacterium]|uniref:Hydrogenase maturation factor n=1 Tax=Serpentinimonas maccroryi TaxID=1458426 RepID=A0A060NZP4_9BURK|nr:hydrogenase formation protein HypD [Serpentinimonas maccroryi]MBA4252599.1 hydrogenase formation protein HypD [Comamonadaceae bacterium]MCL5969237.1 hydrogenase formation protein HypD [Betaproteobacteria bacterium]OYX60992.1 MAG: hydrogenase formation protein HypD [Comamonadaceae bacterium 32-67-11]BAO84324.1 hydrogenase maturation factor [Serpentinimonas maccroryi]